jgi:peptidyl-prolyl cis-trans isomerase A (cyclophilin A)
VAPPVPEPPSLLNPDAPPFQRQAPDSFQVRVETTVGTFLLEVVRAWAPLGVDRFYNLAAIGYFDGVRFFRVLPGFIAQFGIHPDPSVHRAWHLATIPDDPVRMSNLRGTLTFAIAGPNTRANQFFINLADNRRLDGQGFAPFGRVVSGMEVVDHLHAGYGEMPPQGNGPDQRRVMLEGEAYLAAEFPLLDRILRVHLLPPAA